MSHRGKLPKAKAAKLGPLGKVVLIRALAVTAIGVLFTAANLYRPAKARQIDECLSNGGCWDYQRGVCEHKDQCRCTPERCVRGPDGRLVLPDEPAKAIDAGAVSLDGDAGNPAGRPGREPGRPSRLLSRQHLAAPLHVEVSTQVPASLSAQASTQGHVSPPLRVILGRHQQGSALPS